MITIIFAISKNNCIGKDNKLPWHYPKDLAFFKSKVENKTVLMGSNTYKSLKGYYKNKKLPYKKIYVCDLADTKYNDAIKINDIDEFLNKTTEDIYVIGGKIIYELSFKYADILYITYIDKNYEGDTYLNNINLENFNLVNKKKDHELTFTKYERKKKCF